MDTLFCLYPDYEGMGPESRKRLLYRFAAFVKNLLVSYVTFSHGAPDVYDMAQLETSLRRDLSRFAFDNLAYFQRFDEIHDVYYDGGQGSVSRAVTDALNFALAREVAVFKKPVYEERRLCQVADYACCIERAMAAYDSGGPDSHIAFRVDDIDAFHALHEKMGCIVRENPRMGLYFIADPEGQWIEILP